MRQKVLFLTACVLSNLVTFLIVSNTLKPAPVLSGKQFRPSGRAVPFACGAVYPIKVCVSCQ